MDLKPKIEDLADWVPIRFYWSDQKPYVDWCYMGKERFTDSFFDVTIQKRFYEPFNLLFRHQTPIDFLGEMYEKKRGLAPNGFIFHLSRCGSTLISQMLAALPQNIVLSEPPPIDSILRQSSVNSQVSDWQKIDWLKWYINAAGQTRNDEKFYFIKFDSWSVNDLRLITRAFPDVPWIFLYRNPVEVIVSHLRQPGAQMIPGMLNYAFPNLDFTEIMQMPREEFCARILANICENALENVSSKNAKLINYIQLPEIVTSSILDHFRVSYSAADLEKMKSAAQFNAKMPQINFQPDTEEKRKQATLAAHHAAENSVNELYKKLEIQRIKAENAAS